MTAPAPCDVPVNRKLGGFLPRGRAPIPCPAPAEGAPIRARHRVTGAAVELRVCAAHRAALLAARSFRAQVIR